MRVVQYGVALRHSLAVTLAEAARHVRVRNEREDIDEESLRVVKREVLIALNVERVEVAHLHNRLSGVLGLGHLQHESAAQFLRSNLGKAARVVERHCDVDIVVPRNEASVTHGAKQSASVEPVLDVVLATDAVYLLKNGELLELRTTEVALFEFGYIIHL